MTGHERDREDVITVMPYSVNLLHQAERVPPDAERRRADLERGLMAAQAARFWGRALRRAMGQSANGRSRPQRIAC